MNTKPLRQATNSFLIRDDGKILLAENMRGWAKGKWNGAGGKLEPGELPEQAAVREVKEEIGVDVETKDLEKIGEILFRNPDPSWGMYVYIYRTKKWQGEPSESEEMRPAWLTADEALGKKTWPDLPYYFEHILKGQKFKGEFIYKADGETIDHFDIKAVDSL